MNVLGIWDGHHASACLVLEGRLAGAASEERFSRQKMQRGFPHRSISALLENGGIPAEDVDCVALAGRFGRGILRRFNGWFSRLPPGAGPMERPARIQRHYESIMARAPLLREAEAVFGAGAIRRRLKDAGFPRRIPVVYIPHHAAHAAAAGTMHSGETVIHTMDGYGDGLWAASWEKGSDGISLLKEHSYRRSMAVTYGSACQILGYGEGEEGKLTALAASGDPEPLSDFFSRKFAGVFHAGSSRAGPLSAGEARHLQKFKPEDIAAGIQREVEETIVSFVKNFHAEFAGIPVCLAGGLFSNVALNRKIVEALPGSTIRVFPAMGDEGLSVGAACAMLNMNGHALPAFTSPFLGTDLNDPRMEKAAASHRLSPRKESPREQEIARLLLQGKTVALVSGREEFGPRALGNRSLLFSAGEVELKKRVQGMLRRDPVMPFSPVCRDMNLDRCFLPPYPCPDEVGRGLELMTFAVGSSPGTRKTYPTAVHVDGTARVQAVTKQSHPLLYGILEAYEHLSGHRLLINTSFNMHGEPIVHGAEDALKTFRSSGIDCLLLGDTLFEKENGSV